MEDIYQKVQSFTGVFSEKPARTPSNGEPDGPLCGNGDIGVVAGMEQGTLKWWIC